MSGPAALLLTLGALYLLECIAAVPGGHTAFRGTVRASWRILGAGMPYGREGARVVFLPLLPWMHGLMMADDRSSSLDAGHVRERIAAWRDATGALRVDAVGMFVLIFGLAPLSVRMLGWQVSWPFLAIGLVVMALLIVGDYRAAHAQLHPERGGAPFSVLMTIALSPASAMRAPDVLLRRLLIGQHPLAVAHVLCREAEYERMAGECLRAQARVCRESRDVERDTVRNGAIAAFIASTVRDVAKLTAAPVPRDADAASYCPSCLDEYALASGSCTDCGGVELVPFSQVGRCASRSGSA